MDEQLRADDLMAEGWARASTAPWSTTRFDIDGQALVVHRVGLGLPPRTVRFARMGSVRTNEIDTGPEGRRWVQVELTTTDGSVVHAIWDRGFHEQLVRHLRCVSPVTADQLAVDPVDRHPVDGHPVDGHPVDGHPVDGHPPRHHARETPRTRGRHRRRAALCLVALVGLLGADLAVLHARVEREDVGFPFVADDVRTWLLVGSDSRAAAGGFPRPETFGSTDEVPGERADVVLLVQEGHGGRAPRVLSVPRDLLVFRRGHGVDRLALALLDGPTGLTTSICRSLGVPVDHMVTIRFDGVRDLVDAVGGVEVDTPAPTRDLGTGLELPAGRSELDGADAIAWLRSRHVEHRIDGRWSPDPSSDSGRQERQRQLLDQLSSTMFRRARNPFSAQRLAWTVSGAVTTDGHTDPVDLLRLAATLRAAPTHESLPHTLIDGGIPVAQLEPAAQEVLDELRNARPDGPPCPRARIAP